MATAEERAEAPDNPNQYFDFSDLPDEMCTKSGIRITVIKDLNPLQDEVVVTSTPLETADPAPDDHNLEISQVEPLERFNGIDKICQRIKRFVQELDELDGIEQPAHKRDRDRLLSLIHI